MKSRVEDVLSYEDFINLVKYAILSKTDFMTALEGIFVLVPGNMPYFVLGTVFGILGFSAWAYTRGLYMKRIYIEPRRAH